MRFPVNFLLVLLGCAPLIQGQEQLINPPWIKEVAARRIHYSMSGMQAVAVRRNLVYKRVDNRELTADVYSPKTRQPTKGHPAVIFIHGGPLPPNLKTTIKDWGVFVSYGQLAAASGFVGVTFNSRFYDWAKIGDPQSDVREVIAYVRENAKDLSVDPDRIILWAFSAGGLLLSDQLSDPRPYVRSIVAYYPILDPQNIRSRVPSSISDESLKAFSPVHIVGTSGKKLPPMLIARAGFDADLNGGVDAFIQAALSKNLTIEILNHPNGQHAFDVRDDNERTREIIRRTLDFLKTHG